MSLPPPADSKGPDVAAVEHAELEKADVRNDHLEGNAFLVNHTTGKVRLIPVPSDNPNDPLNYTFWQKTGLVVVCCWFSIMSLTVAGGLSTILNVLDKLYAAEGRSEQQVTYLASFANITIGLGNFIIVPLALAYGRRPMLLGSCTFMLIGVVWATFCKSYNSHLGARVFQGLAAGASESLLPLMISEITFMHQRGFLFGCYWTAQSLLTAVLSVASSYEASISWRWFYGVFAFALLAGLVAAIFFGLETRFPRPPVSVDGQIMYTDEFGATRVLSDEEAKQYLAEHAEFYNRQQLDQSIRKMTYLQTLNPWPGKSPKGLSIAGRSYLRMLECYTSPGVLYAILAGSVTMGCAQGMGVTISVTLADVYNWPSANVGLYNLGTVPAALLALLYSGWCADRISVWMAKRNGGIHKPEMRLIPLIFPCIVGIIALMIYGVCVQYPERYSWAGPVIAWNLYQFTFISVLVTTTTFAAEVRPKDPGPALVVVAASKNFIAFGLQYAMVPLVDAKGYLWSLGILAIIFAISFVVGIPVYFFNPWWRKKVSGKNGPGHIMNEQDLHDDGKL